jgi:predicted metal-dependent hydrolase
MVLRNLKLAIERKGVKNVNARLTGSTLSVSAPRGMPQEALDEAVLRLARRLLRRAHASRVNEAHDALKLANAVAKRFPKEPAVQRVAFVTTQRKRWGSYSTKTKTVRLNAAVRRMPRWVLEAVVAHELAHTFHADHSRAFWDLLRRVCLWPWPRDWPTASRLHRLPLGFFPLLVDGYPGVLPAGC